jgi:hypothetical protein
MTYVELVAAIESYTENSYPTVDVNTFITQAENRIFNAVNLPDLRANDTGTISAGNKYLNVPVDWLATYSLAVIDTATNEYTFLLNKDVNFIRESFPDTDVAHYGKPKYYAVFDDTTFILGPTPDIGYGAELEAATYLKSDAETITNYSQRYNQAMEELLGLGEGKNTRDAYRSGQARIPVRGRGAT